MNRSPRPTPVPPRTIDLKFMARSVRSCVQVRKAKKTLQQLINENCAAGIEPTELELDLKDVTRRLRPEKIAPPSHKPKLKPRVSIPAIKRSDPFSRAFGSNKVPAD